MKNKERYNSNQMDAEINKDVDALRSMLEGVPAPSEPHPAYWNNFLLRVHERVEAEQSPQKRAWYSPALIWSTLTGVAALVVIALATGVFSGNPIEEGPIIADGPSIEKPVTVESDIDLVPMDDEMALLLSDIDEMSDVAEDHVVLSQDELEMLEAIENGDDNAILEAMLSDVSVEI